MMENNSCNYSQMKQYELPHILFLDLNMPRKNGFECLSEIKHNNKLKDLPVVIFSTSFEQEVVNLLYKNGAQYFIRKPSVFLQFKEIILHALLLVMDRKYFQLDKRKFCTHSARQSDSLRESILIRNYRLRNFFIDSKIQVSPINIKIE